VSIPVFAIIDEQYIALTIDLVSIAPSCKARWRVVARAIDLTVPSKALVP
jgi:hypothetical protein